MSAFIHSLSNPANNLILWQQYRSLVGGGRTHKHSAMPA